MLIKLWTMEKVICSEKKGIDTHLGPWYTTRAMEAASRPFFSVKMAGRPENNTFVC